MSKNSKAHRDAKAKTRQRQLRAAAGGTAARPAGDSGIVGGFPGPGAAAPGGAGPMVRSSCSECGSTDLNWMPPAELAERVPAQSRARVQEISEVVGLNADTWLCGQCGNFGVVSSQWSTF
jgi:hypothetical protein